MFADKIYIGSYGRTLFYIGMTLVLEVLVGLLLAGIVSSKIKGSILFRTAFFAPAMLPGVVVGLIWSFVYNQRFGLLNSLLTLFGLESWARSWLGDSRTALIAVCVVSGWVFSGYYMTIFYAAMQRIPRELFEAAEIDGAGPVLQFLKVKLPLTMDMVWVAVLLCVTGGFQGFDLFCVIFFFNDTATTEIYTTWLVRTVFSIRDVGYGAALSVMLTAVVLFLTWLIVSLQKRLLSGDDTL
jgi:raffinose/stachyose/melibiose transport system permease protein